MIGHGHGHGHGHMRVKFNLDIGGLDRDVAKDHWRVRGIRWPVSLTFTCKTRSMKIITIGHGDDCTW